MEIDFTQELMDLAGTKPLVLPETTTAVTFRWAAIAALTAIDADVRISGKQKFKQGLLAQKIATQDTADLNLEELKSLKDVVGKFLDPTAVLRIWNILDPPTKD